MGEIAITLLKWTIKTSFIIAVCVALISILNLITSLFMIGFNQNVMNDILVLVQIWLPFNLSVILMWISSAVIAYFAIKIAIVSYNLLTGFIEGLRVEF